LPPLVAVAVRSAVCLIERFPALAGADLDVAVGETVLLSGPNGAGKSTMLRMLAGLLPIHTGSAVVLGVDLTRDRRSHRRRLALVGHATFGYDDLSALENVRFAARACGRAASAGEGALERMGLESAAKVAHGRLSAGQRRRMSLAMALAREPELLLLDEPHAGLDAEGRALLDGMLAARTAAPTVVIASHEVELVRPYANREVRIEGGLARPLSGGSDAGVVALGVAS
jgi:ABC-type multidrug transport system ATPase subunit